MHRARTIPPDGVPAQRSEVDTVAIPNTEIKNVNVKSLVESHSKNKHKKKYQTNP